ncbi:hypothetical protein D3C76_1612730 [compost metagenome]
MDIERHLAFVLHLTARQMLIAEDKLLHLVDHFGGIENGHRLNHPPQGEILQQQIVDLRHLFLRGDIAKDAHQRPRPLPGNQ